MFCFIVKYSFLVKKVEDIFEIIKKVFYIVLMGCFGFVVIDVLKDVMSLFNKLFYEYLEIIKMCFYNLMMVGYKG